MDYLKNQTVADKWLLFTIQVELSLGTIRGTTKAQIFVNIVKLQSYIIKAKECAVIKVHVKFPHILYYHYGDFFF